MIQTAKNQTAEAQALAFYRSMRDQPPVRLPPRAEDEAALTRSRRIRFGVDGSLSASVFGDEGGPLVALMHGWGGQGTQFFRMAMNLAIAGYQAVVMDFGNHGEAAPAELGFDRFMIDARALADHLGTMPAAWVAHSAAALAILSARRTHGLSGQAFITIAAPFTPYVPLNRFRSMGAGEDAIEAIKPLLAQEFACDWDALEAGLAWQRDDTARLLAIYDTNDAMVQVSDCERIAAVWPDCRIIRTGGYGHNRVLGADEVVEATLEFLGHSLSGTACLRKAQTINH